MSNDGAILEMSDFMISYRPKPACVIGKDVFYVHRTKLGRGEPREETEHRQICIRLVQVLKTRGNRQKFA